MFGVFLRKIPGRHKDEWQVSVLLERLQTHHYDALHSYGSCLIVPLSLGYCARRSEVWPYTRMKIWDEGMGGMGEDMIDYFGNGERYDYGL
jgi:hypothetical protein